MKAKMYNDYDGYMYTVHNLLLGEFTYQGITYNLDDIEESTTFLNILNKEGFLISQVITNVNYSEQVYKIKEELPYKIFRKDSVLTNYLQRKATCLNAKVLLTSDIGKDFFLKKMYK